MRDVIKIQHVSKYYGDFCALDNLSLTVSKGEVLGLLGPNGAGKSTTIKLITGMMAATEGEVFLNGVDLAKQPLLAKRQLGYLPEHPPVYADLTIDEYLLFCARLRQVKSENCQAAILQVKKRCQLDDMGSRLIKHLSKGYQQRVGIAQAILHQPKIVVLDEPTSGLDPNQIRQMLALIKHLAKDQAILLSTHILSEVEAVCDRVLVLHQGRQVYCDSLSQLRDQTPAFRVCFRHEPDVSELQALVGIQSVCLQDDGCFELQLIAEAHINEVMKQCVNYGLLELTPSRPSLEQLFTRLTLGTAL